MTIRHKRQCEISLRMPAELKKLIENAAVISGQTVDDYAISVLKECSHKVLESHALTMLSNRDRDRFIAAIDQTDVKPNRSLVAAVRRYRKRIR